VLYYSDLDEETYFAIYGEDETSNKRIISFLSSVYGKEFEEVSSDWADDYGFEKDTLIIKVNFFIEDVLEIAEKGFDILIIK
jgi:hypothetical protein